MGCSSFKKGVGITALNMTHKWNGKQRLIPLATGGKPCLAKGTTNLFEKRSSPTGLLRNRIESSRMQGMAPPNALEAQPCSWP